MDRKIGLIASDKEFEKSIIELFKEDVEKGNIIIDILDPDNIEKQGKVLESKGVKAIIVRGGGYCHTVGRVNIPVIQLKRCSGQIIIRCLSRTRIYNGC